MTASTSVSLEADLEDLHRESNYWLSQVEFWRIELAFYQKLLEKITVRTSDIEDKKRISHFQNLITYFNGELLDQFAHDIRQHEKYPKKLLLEEVPVDEQEYKLAHKKYEEEIRAFEEDFKQYRRDLYAFAGNFI